ncbi:MAG TPA: NAD(P)H-hydrate epimerase [Planctomycetota bacterium]|nr:NAD(P)H-hydrate epimerase [Planctomycetota bacterium]
MPDAHAPPTALTADEALAMDRWLVSRGFTLAALMATAGARVADAARRLARERQLQRAVFLVGPGNNGGDALVAERLLRGELETLVWQPLPRAAGADRDPPPRRVSEAPPLDARTLLVDGLFGVGLARPLEGAARAAVQHVSDSRATVLAIDVPSGLSATTGEVVGGARGAALRAHATVTFVAPKTGFFRAAGPEHVGQVYVVDLGFPPSELEPWLTARRAGAAT